MTIVDYILVGGVAALAIHVGYRLFVGWRNSAFPQNQSEKDGN
jgi:hypothetical protein